jgi:signal transduction histidine kinase
MDKIDDSGKLVSELKERIDALEKENFSLKGIIKELSGGESIVGKPDCACFEEKNDLDCLMDQEIELWNIWRKLYHDLVSELSVINLASQGLAKYYPKLVSACSKAYEQGIDLELPSKMHLDLLQGSLETLNQSTIAHLWRLKFYRMQLNPLESKNLSLKSCQIKNCLDEAFCDFPNNELQKVDLSEVKDFSFHGDHEVVKHVIFNLLDNAVYQAKANGSLKKENWLRIFVTNDDGCNYLHFRDSAGGISSEVLPQVFDKYFTTKQCKPGLGLYFCQKAMHCFGGDIKCNTDVNQGFTDFVLGFQKT